LGGTELKGKTNRVEGRGKQGQGEIAGDGVRRLYRNSFFKEWRKKA